MTTPLSPVTFTRADGATFTLQPEIPASFAARLDLDTLMGSLLPPEMTVRAWAVALGLALGGKAPSIPSPSTGEPMTLRPMPVYANNGLIREYSTVVVDHLIRAWGVASDDEGMWSAAVTLSQAIRDTLPTKQGVEAAKAFTSASGAA